MYKIKRVSDAGKSNKVILATTDSKRVDELYEGRGKVDQITNMNLF